MTYTCTHTHTLDRQRTCKDTLKANPKKVSSSVTLKGKEVSPEAYFKTGTHKKSHVYLTTLGDLRQCWTCAYSSDEKKKSFQAHWVSLKAQRLIRLYQLRNSPKRNIQHPSLFSSLALSFSLFSAWRCPVRVEGFYSLPVPGDEVLQLQQPHLTVLHHLLRVQMLHQTRQHPGEKTTYTFRNVHVYTQRNKQTHRCINT